MIAVSQLFQQKLSLLIIYFVCVSNKIKVRKKSFRFQAVSISEDEQDLQLAPACFFLAEYLALAGLMNFLAQLSDKIHHFTVYNLMPLAFLTKLSKMH